MESNYILHEVLLLAATLHQQRTGTIVGVNVADMPATSPAVVMTMFRFAQEGLNNAFKHAGAKQQILSAQCDGKKIMVEVEDAGSSFDQAKLVKQDSGTWGLAAMEHRIKMNGGEFEIYPSCGTGTRLVAKFAVDAGERFGERHQLIENVSTSAR